MHGQLADVKAKSYIVLYGNGIAPPSYFIHISITTPIVSALKTIILYRGLSGSSNGF
jgi:hypothetical protein